MALLSIKLSQIRDNILWGIVPRLQGHALPRDVGPYQADIITATNGMNYNPAIQGWDCTRVSGQVADTRAPVIQGSEYTVVAWCAPRAGNTKTVISDVGPNDRDGLQFLYDSSQTFAVRFNNTSELLTPPGEPEDIVRTQLVRARFNGLQDGECDLWTNGRLIDTGRIRGATPTNPWRPRVGASHTGGNQHRGYILGVLLIRSWISEGAIGEICTQLPWEILEARRHVYFPVSGVAIPVREVEEQVTVSDSWSITNAQKSVAEAVGVADSWQLIVRLRELSEGVGVADSFGITNADKTVSEGVGVADSFGITNADKTVSEGVGVSDDWAVILTPAESIAEGVAVSDSFIISKSDKTVSEGVGVADQWLILANERLLAEFVGVADSWQLIVRLKELSEGVGVADSWQLIVTTDVGQGTLLTSGLERAELTSGLERAELVSDLDDRK